MCNHCPDRFQRITNGQRLPDNPLICRVFRAWEHFYPLILTFARKIKKALIITCEIVAPGSIKRKKVSLERAETPEKRWQGILDTCAKIVSETEPIKNEA